jgi:RecA-family ATPase
MVKPSIAPKTGQEIRLALSHPAPIRCPVVDEFLYRKKVTLLTAAPGLGKSTIAQQVAFSVTAGIDVFGVLEVAKPVKVYYIAFETDWEEFVGAMHKALPIIKFNPDMLVFDDGLLGIDICTIHEHPDPIIDRIKAHNPGLIIIDPLYLIVAGDLSDGKIASAAMKWFQRLAVFCNAAVLVLHHTHRERYAANGKKINEEDDSYGSRWIQANVVIQYNVKQEGCGTHWSLKKDRYKMSRKEMVLSYDPETLLSSALKSKNLIKDELLAYIQWHKPGSEFTYPGLAEQFKCAEGYLSHLMLLPSFQKLIKKDAPPGRPVTLRRIHCEDLDGAKLATTPAATVNHQPATV